MYIVSSSLSSLREEYKKDLYTYYITKYKAYQNFKVNIDPRSDEIESCLYLWHNTWSNRAEVGCFTAQSILEAMYFAIFVYWSIWKNRITIHLMIFE